MRTSDSIGKYSKYIKKIRRYEKMGVNPHFHGPECFYDLYDIDMIGPNSRIRVLGENATVDIYKVTEDKELIFLPRYDQKERPGFFDPKIVLSRMNTHRWELASSFPPFKMLKKYLKHK